MIVDRYLCEKKVAIHDLFGPFQGSE